MTFYLSQDDKLTIKKVHFEIMKRKFVIITTNPLVYYIFSKVYLYLYIKLT